jgi:predicted amidohydrolase YtcJ
MHSGGVRALKHILAIAAASVAALAGSPLEAARGKAAADLILTNARVYTVDAAHPWAQAVAIRGDRIVAVGSDVAVARHKGRATKVVDLRGRLLLPAFGDAHVHPVFGGMTYSRCSLRAGKTTADYRAIIAGCIAKTPGTGVVFGVGWEDSLFPGGIPRKEELDAVSSDRPLIFRSLGGHSLWLNSKALALLGISKSTPDPEHGKIDRDPATGEAVGGLEEGAMALADPFIPPPTATEMQDAIIYMAKYANSVGITDWHDAGIEFTADGRSPILDAYAAVLDQGKLTSHVSIALKWQNENGLEQLPALFRAADYGRSLGLFANAVKFYIDGVIPQKTAAMLEPYENSIERGSPEIAPARLKEAVTRVVAHGMQPHFHAIGDGAVREALDAVAAAEEARPNSDPRAMVSHLNVVDPADIPRFGKLGAAAVLQPLWASEYPYMRLMEQTIGKRRSQWIYPAKSILKAGGMLSYGSDWPVASANPLEGIEVAITRTTHGGPDKQPLLPREGVTLPQAIKAYTLNVAYVNHLDKETGSIVPGKIADLIVLDKDIFRMPAAEISTAKVLVTLFKGREVFGSVGSLR